MLQLAEALASSTQLSKINLCVAKRQHPSRQGRRMHGAALQQRGVTTGLARAISVHILSSSKIRELELGVALHSEGARARRYRSSAKLQLAEMPVRVMLTLGVLAGMAVLGRALAHAWSVRRVSFAGSGCGDQAAAALLEGLCANPRLESLSLAHCALTDALGRGCATVLRAHAASRSQLQWQAALRVYEPPVGAPPPSPREEPPVGGLLFLDLCGNCLSQASVLARAASPAAWRSLPGWGGDWGEGEPLQAAAPLKVVCGLASTASRHPLSCSAVSRGRHSAMRCSTNCGCVRWTCLRTRRWRPPRWGRCMLP